jgi:phage shock protein PspC (stress-responsive transcriptional regulator)
LAEYSDNYKVQSIINEYVEEVRKCSIFAYNEIDDIDLARLFIGFAEELAAVLPVSTQIKDSIEESRTQFHTAIQNKENENFYTTIFNHLKIDIASLSDAEKSVSFYKRELAKIQNKDATYIQTSSICVNVVLEYLIDVFNQVREEFPKNKDFNKLYTTAKKVKDITHSLKKFTVEPEVAERLNKNWRVIDSEYDDIAELKRKIDNGEFKLNTQSNDEVVAGTLGRMAEAWGWNANFLRAIYGVGALVTYIWPAVILYVILCFVFPKKG